MRSLKRIDGQWKVGLFGGVESVREFPTFESAFNLIKMFNRVIDGIECVKKTNADIPCIGCYYDMCEDCHY